METFFTPGEEILLPAAADDVVRILTEISPDRLREIGQRAQERVLEEHTSQKRAEQFENYVSTCSPGGLKSLASALTPAGA
jgi:spore maturation protein CgeB